jgi:hypothetical protein
MTRVLVPLAQGCEELEAGTVMDFALESIEALLGHEQRDTVEKSLERS